jgi:hypothetical protein
MSFVRDVNKRWVIDQLVKYPLFYYLPKFPVVAAANVSRFAFHMLRIRHTTHSGIMQRAAIPAIHCDWLPQPFPRRLQHIRCQRVKVVLNAIRQLLCLLHELTLAASSSFLSEAPCQFLLLKMFTHVLFLLFYC